MAKAARALALLAPAATVLAALSDLAQLERIEVTTAPEITVTLHLTEPAAMSATSMPAEGGAPNRIFVELARTRLGRSERGVTGGGTLRRVRTEQVDASTARVVLELSRPTEFRVESHGSVVVVTLVGRDQHPVGVPQVEPPIIPTP